MRTLILLLTIAVLLSLTNVAHSDPGDIEARAGIVALAPDPEITFGGGVAVELLTIDPDWWLIGALLPNRKVFGDVLYIEGQGALGGSVSLKPADRDNKLRGWVAAWKEDDFKWSVGLAYGYPIDWSW